MVDPNLFDGTHAMTPIDAPSHSSVQPFGRAASQPLQALAHVRVADLALHFVDRGVRDLHGKTADPLHSFTSWVKYRLLENATGALMPSTRTYPATAYKDADLQAWQSFVALFQSTATVHFRDLCVPALGAVDAEQAAHVCRTLGCRMAGEAPKETTPVRQAWAMARYNVERAEQRIATLYALSCVARQPGGSIAQTAAETELQLASEKLWARRANHVSRMLAFGTLLGGEYLRHNKEFVKAMFGENISVIELLQVDGHTPNRWPDSQERALRDAIAKA